MVTENDLAKLFSHSLTPGPHGTNYLNALINKLIELRAAKTVIEDHGLSDEWHKMTAKARMEVVSWIAEEADEGTDKLA
jgi:hypothetical protein